jgi:hypothetical protein
LDERLPHLLSNIFYKKKQWEPPMKKEKGGEKTHTDISSFADGGKVHLRTGLELCAGKRQAGRETLTTRHLPVALTPHAKTLSRCGKKTHTNMPFT